MKKQWAIPVTWRCSGLVYVEAATLDEAMDIAETSDSIGLPDGDYTEDGFVEQEGKVVYV